MNISQRFIALSLLSGIVFSVACVSHRKKGQTSALGRFYHNTTAKYNGYFNANELMDECLLTLEQNHKDNFNKILPVFPFNAVESADPVKSKLDKAIEKVSVVITNHRVSHWTDDCYLLLAKAQYLKKDFETAESSYRFFLDEFDPFKNRLKSKKIKAKTAEEKKNEAEDLKKERKKAAEQKAKERKKLQKEREKAKKSSSKNKKPVSEPKPEIKQKDVLVSGKTKPEQDKSGLTNEGSWLFPHYPAYWEGAIWAARNLVERGKPYEAEQLLRKVERDPYASASLKEDLYASYADLYLKTGNQAKAIPALKSAIEFSGSKKRKARYAFILGQVYQNAGRRESASEYFTQCIKSKPSYELVLHAKLNLLLNEAEEGEVSDVVASKIQKMVDDPKNKEFLGELHFSLAMIYLKQNHADKAVEEFNLALRSPNATNSQRAEAYFQLAELNFSKQAYLEAKLYYDSTMTMLSKNDERRAKVSKVVASLEDIAKNLQNIALQDSLLRVAGLSVKDKRALAVQLKNARKNKTVEPVASKDPRSRFAELEALSANPFAKEEGNNADIRKTPSNFFAYDQRAINRGRSEFEQIWGTRNLEDNWRRKNKNTFAINEIKNETPEEKADTLEADLAQILKGIPETPEQIEAANQSIAESMFQLGVLYREKLENLEKSNASLKELIKRYPKTNRKADAIYYLYLNCLDQGETSCSNSYKDQLAYEFPGSHFSKILTDPEYVKSLMAKRDEVSSDYDKAYQMYTAKNYTAAYDLLQIVKNKIQSGHKLAPKTALLAAFCVGNLQGKDVYVNALKDVVANYPSTPEEIKAKEILRFLKGDQDAFIQIRESELEKTNFKEEDDKLHFIIVLMFQPEDKQVDKAKISISDYHENYHKSENLKMSSVELDTENNNPIIVVRKFNDKKQAMKYYKGVLKKPKEYITGFDNWEIFAISQNNYREILRIKSLTEYKSFFKKYYEETN